MVREPLNPRKMRGFSPIGASWGPSFGSFWAFCPLLERILGLAGLVVVGLIVYGILALMMRIATVDDLRRALSRRPASV